MDVATAVDEVLAELPRPAALFALRAAAEAGLRPLCVIPAGECRRVLVVLTDAHRPTGGRVVGLPFHLHRYWFDPTRGGGAWRVAVDASGVQSEAAWSWLSRPHPAAVCGTDWPAFPMWPATPVGPVEAPEVDSLLPDKVSTIRYGWQTAESSLGPTGWRTPRPPADPADFWDVPGQFGVRLTRPDGVDGFVDRRIVYHPGAATRRASVARVLFADPHAAGLPVSDYVLWGPDCVLRARQWLAGQRLSLVRGVAHAADRVAESLAAPGSPWVSADVYADTSAVVALLYPTADRYPHHAFRVATHTPAPLDPA